jgi:hypothetical protein
MVVDTHNGGNLPVGAKTMDTWMLTAWEWARAEFGGADLGDPRRTRRLVKVVEALAQDPHGALHRVLSDWAELMGAYRLVGSSAVSFERVTDPHHQRTRQSCSQPGEYLMIEDTTALDFTRHAAAEGLGRIGNDGGRGFYLHTTLALRVETWMPDQAPCVSVTGLLAQRCWARTMPSQTQEPKKARLRRDRESQRWADSFIRDGGPASGVRWTLIADREADIYELFQKCRSCRVDWIIRASQPRALVDQDGSILTAVSQNPPLGSFRLHVRARPGRSARTADLEIRAGTVTFRGPWRPEGRPAPMEIQVVEVREIQPPSGLEPLHWILLTSWPVQDGIWAQRVVKSYASRELVEEYHKALKTGTGVEESQLTQASSLLAWIGILSIVAMRLLSLKLLSRTHPNDPVAENELGPEARIILSRKFGEPPEGWTYQTSLIRIARLGGFKARKSDGLPGWISLWRGWGRLIILIEGFQLAQEPS